jgi:hypothetical protein
MLPFGEWLPDGPPFGNPGTVLATNVLPRTQAAYGPMLGPVPYSDALPSQVCGSYGYREANGTVFNFAATTSHLYLQQTGQTSFSDVSGLSAPFNTGTPPDGFWSMTSFGSRVIATNYDDDIQTFNCDSDTVFSNLSSAAPRAKFCAVIKDFLMLGNTVDSLDGVRQFRVSWPAIGDPTNWPPWGSNTAIELQSDYQDLVQTDLGAITGLVGGHLSAADGAAWCERGIYRIMYAGSPAIFSFSVAEGAAGTDSSLSIVQRRLVDGSGVARSVVYYLGSDGFYAFDGTSSTSIGGQKVDRFFFGDLDPNRIRNVQGTYDPRRKLVFWFYHGIGNNGLYNRAIVYNWELARWSLLDLTPIPVEWVESTTYSTNGYNLDQMDSFGDLEQINYSFDSLVWTQGNPMVAWFDGNHVQNYTTGPSLPVTIETGEKQLFPDRRTRIIKARPLHDAQVPAQISVGVREMTRHGVVYRPAVVENILGECPQRTTGRYTRYQVMLPAGAGFQFLQGVDVTAVPEGTRSQGF